MFFGQFRPRCVVPQLVESRFLVTAMWPGMVSQCVIVNYSVTTCGTTTWWLTSWLILNKFRTYFFHHRSGLPRQPLAREILLRRKQWKSSSTDAQKPERAPGIYGAPSVYKLKCWCQFRLCWLKTKSSLPPPVLPSPPTKKTYRVVVNGRRSRSISSMSVNLG